MDNLYYTQSLNLAAYLKYRGKNPISSETIKGITTFYFDKDEETYQIVRDYNSNEDLKGFISAFRDIKFMIKK